MSKKNKTTDIVFVHGAGEGSYEWTLPMLDALKRKLGPDYVVHLLRMPNPESGDYQEWAQTIEEALSALRSGVLLVGHSYGGSVLLRLIAENRVPNPISALVLLAVPYWGKGGWDVPDFKMPVGFESKLTSVPHISLFHCKDDETVPFFHMELYRKKIAKASVHAFGKGGHALEECMPHVAHHILSLHSGL
jgi:predicted alpha/beta hydrolase family esterase